MDKVRVLKNKKIKTPSSKKWLLRQLNDPFVHKAQKDGYRSRASYKIIEIDKKFKIFKKGLRVIDLGAAPGGWTQIALDRVGEKGCVIGINLLPILPLQGAHLLQGDFSDEVTLNTLKELCLDGVDVVLSDMAPSTCGIAKVDHIRIMALLEEALLFAEEHLKPKGSFVAKVLQGGTEGALLTRMKVHFDKVFHFKPSSSRQESKEMYVVACGFRRQPPYAS